MHITKILTFALLAALFGALLVGCSSGESAREAVRDPNLTVDARLVQANHTLAYRLCSELQDDGNLFFSPASIQLLLSMVYNGANMQVREEMAQTLGISGMTLDEFNLANANLLQLLVCPDERTRIEIANAAWLQQGNAWNPTFQSNMQNSYGAEIGSLDFAKPSAAADTINAWVNEQTHRMIPELVTADDLQNAVAMLANTLYFRGVWTDAFNPDDTEMLPFTLPDQTTVNVPTMSRMAEMDYLETAQFQRVELPFGKGYCSLYLYLPKAGTSIADLLEALSEQELPADTQELVSLDLPRLQVNTSLQLQPSLTDLGLGTMFSSGLTEMFSLPAGPTGEPFLSAIIHKAVINLDEQGVTAAAATGGVVPVGPIPNRMSLNRPFLLVLQDNPTGIILFMGVINNPATP